MFYIYIAFVSIKIGDTILLIKKIAPPPKGDHPSSFGKAYLRYVLSVLLRFTDSDYPFGIFKLF
jgi:hypothetical protein